jgi:hypothetical protein
MNKGLQVLVLSVIFVSVLLISPAALSTVENESTIQIDDSTFPATDYVPRDIRVAIYDEPNMTAPTYATNPGGRNNNATGLRDILLSYGYDVTLLDVHDIYNYELTTANFDVLCLVDNFPRENITHRIMDFWLGGGGLLVFDGSAGFLCSFGILPPEAIGTDGSPTYWEYSGSNIVFTGLHPVSKSVAPGTITNLGGYLRWNWLILQGTTIGSDLTRVASTGQSINEATILAFDPSDRGGRVATIALDLANEYIPEMEPLYADAVDWLAPRPKARILYDLTHQPWCPIDTWEWNGDSNFLTTWRNTMVANHFTVDKLHPSFLGNLTAENLAPYDMLVSNQPMVDISPSEVQAVEEWVQAGGGLLAIGDNPGVPDNYRLDELISPFGFQFNDTVTPYNTGVWDFDMHPTTEGCTSLLVQGATNLILSGDAYPIWRYTDGEAVVGAAEYGAGRVVVVADTNTVLDSWIGAANNHEFAQNVVNWLTTTSARVLLYHDVTGIFPYNFYRSAVADALNELGIEFMLTFDYLYFNLSMQMQEWDLIICDANSQSSVVNYRFILDHLENGGKLIMRDFLFRAPNGTNGWDLSLYTYIGFEGAGWDERITDGAPTVYMWDEYHNVFDRPIDFSVDRFESTANFYTTDWTNVTLHANATAIAGITPTPEINQSAIIIGAEGRALCNLFSISQYYDDYDQSTYSDNFELWLNEIAYMMRPTIDPLDDFSVVQGTLSFEWVGHSYAPADYQVKRDSAIIATHVWDGSPITVDISGLTVGTYVFELMVRDHVGYRADDMVIVTIEEPPTTPEPTTTPTSPTTPPPGDLTMILIIAAVAGVIVVIVLIFLMKKKKT